MSRVDHLALAPGSRIAIGTLLDTISLEIGDYPTEDPPWYRKVKILMGPPKLFKLGNDVGLLTVAPSIGLGVGLTVEELKERALSTLEPPCLAIFFKLTTKNLVPFSVRDVRIEE